MQQRRVRWMVQAAMVGALAATPFLIEWVLPEQHLTVEERFELDRAFAELEQLVDRAGSGDATAPPGTGGGGLPWDDLEGEEP
jgi:hypothetical protein